jgi:hypothetical protein
MFKLSQKSFFAKSKLVKKKYKNNIFGGIFFVFNIVNFVLISNMYLTQF